MKLRSKTLVAIAAAASLLILSSSPASATANTLVASGGSITTVLGTYTLGSGGTPGPCGASSGGITLDITGGATPWTTAVTAANIVTSTTQSGGDYLVEITKHTSGSQAGTITTGPPHNVTQNAAFRVEIFNASGAPSCVKGTKVCTVRATFAGPLTGTLSAVPTGNSLASGDVATLSGNGAVQTIVGQSCGAPFAGLINSTATLSSAQFTV